MDKLLVDKLNKYKQKYEESKSKANFLIYGKHGVGKTCMLETCPGTVLVHNFDPGGPKVLDHSKDKERIHIFDFSNDDLANPTSYREWEKQFNEMLKDKVFDDIDFYVIDSLTMLTAMMFATIKQKMGVIKDPRQYYGGLIDKVKEVFIKLTAMPCHVIVFGHMDTRDNPMEEKIYHVLHMPGQGRLFLPTIFDEFYYMHTKKVGVEKVVNGKKTVVQEEQRLLLTQVSGKHDCRTRIGRDLFDKEEVADIGRLLEKAGYIACPSQIKK